MYQVHCLFDRLKKNMCVEDRFNDSCQVQRVIVNPTLNLAA